MTTTLIVLAHPNPNSFNGSWAKATHRACKDLGHEVLWSDLVTMNFHPVESKQHYSVDQNSDGFDPLKAQETASRKHQLPDDVYNEIKKLRSADRVIFHFPMWWFAPPAILKGWFDRVFLHGEMHTIDERFDRGQFVGKKALFCVTTGATDAESSFNGKEGDIQMLLWPVAYTLRYLGFSVLRPEVVHGVHSYHEGKDRELLQERLSNVLADQANLIAEFDQRPLMNFNPDDDFDEAGSLKPDRSSYSSSRRGRLCKMKRRLITYFLCSLIFAAQAQESAFPPLTDYVLGRAEASGATISFTLQNNSPCVLDDVDLRVLHNGIYKTTDEFKLVTLLSPGETGQFIKTLTQVVNDDWNWTIDRVTLSNPTLNPACTNGGLIQLEYIDFGPPVANLPTVEERNAALAAAAANAEPVAGATTMEENSGPVTHTVERGGHALQYRAALWYDSFCYSAGQ